LENSNDLLLSFKNMTTFHQCAIKPRIVSNCFQESNRPCRCVSQCPRRVGVQENKSTLSMRFAVPPKVGAMACPCPADSDHNRSHPVLQNKIVLTRSFSHTVRLPQREGRRDRTIMSIMVIPCNHCSSFFPAHPSIL